MKTKNRPLPRIVSACVALLATSLSLPAQTAPASDNSDQVVQMSKFEVITTQGHGYVSTNAASAFKTNTSLLDLPQIDTVITRDLIDDIGATDSSNITQYFGLSNFYAGEAFAARGYRITYAYVDDIPSNQPYEDNGYIDTYEVIKGPAQVLYLNASLSGTVLKSTKKPLPYRQDTLTAQINSGDGHYLYRFMLDSTGPIGQFQDAKIGYRLVLIDHGGPSYFKYDYDQNYTIFPVFDVDWKSTTLRVYAYHMHGYHFNAGSSLITPDGNLYTGMGRDRENYTPMAGGHELHDAFRYYGSLDTRISNNWENSVKMGEWTLKRYGSIAYVAADNFNNDTLTLNSRLNNIRYSYWAFLDDFQGNWNLGTLKNTDAFGGGWSEYTVKQELWSATPEGFSNPTIALNNAAAEDAVVVPPNQSYNVAYFGNDEGLHNQTVVTALYYQHTIDIVPNYVTLVAGWDWSNITTEGTANVSVLPWTTVTTPSHEWLHRYGVIVKPIKDVSLYAMESGQFTPPTQGAILEDGSLPPPQLGRGDEIGFKTALMGGKISTDAAWFRMTTTNVLAVGGVLPNALSYWVPVGSTVQEGFDGDAAFAITHGFQIIGSFYAGHDRDQTGKPVSNSYDNQWAALARYQFDRDSSLHGWAIGAGIVRVGGRWISTSGMTYSGFNPFTAWSGEIKLKTGTLANAFVTYELNRHWEFRLSCTNMFNDTYVLGEQTALVADPSLPRNFELEIDFKL